MARHSPRPWCSAPHCAMRGQHRDDCLDVEECRGCLPRLAADGLRLCDVCARRLGEDALLVVARHADLELVLTGGAALGELVATSSDPNMSINERAAQLRGEIERALAGICAMIARERGLAGPRPAGWYQHLEELPAGFIGPPRMLRYRVEDVLERASYVGRHREWLAAHTRGGAAAGWLRDLAHGESYRVAYPSGGRMFEVKTPRGPAPCPETVHGEPCRGTLWTILRRTDSLWPAELACNADANHRIPFADWLRRAQRLRRRAGLDDTLPAPEPRAAARPALRLCGGPRDGQDVTATASPPPAALSITVTDPATGRTTRHAYRRRAGQPDLYDYIGVSK